MIHPSNPSLTLPVASIWSPTDTVHRAWWLHEPQAHPVRLSVSEAYGIVQRVQLQPYRRIQDEYLYLADIETGERGRLPHYPPDTVFAVTALDGLCYGMRFQAFIAADVVAFAAHTDCLPALVQRFGSYTALVPLTQEPVVLRWCWT